MATGTSDAGGSCCDGGRAASLERVRYFPGQLLTPDDLTADQDHVRAKLRRHNLLLHGWGVVCGAGVRAAPRTTGPSSSSPGTSSAPRGTRSLSTSAYLSI